MSTTLTTAVSTTFVLGSRPGALRPNTKRRSGNGSSGAAECPSRSWGARKSANSSTGSTTSPLQNMERTRVAPRTRPANTCEPSSPGLGTRNSSRPCQDSRSPSRSATWQAGTISPRPRSMHCTSALTRWSVREAGTAHLPWAAIGELHSSFLQLRRRHRDRLEICPVPRTDSLATRIVGSRIAGPGSQGAFTLGMALLPQGQDGQGVLSPDEPCRPRPYQEYHAGESASR